MSNPRRIPPGSVETFLEARALLNALGHDLDAETHWTDLGRELGAVCTACDDPARSRGFCDTHYRRHVRATRNEAALINRKDRTAA